MAETDIQLIRERMVEGYDRMVPHNTALGSQVVSAEDGIVQVRLPFREHFLGDPQAGLWHTAVSLSLLDGACGLAVMLALPRPEGIATLDLRVDYLRPAIRDQALQARAECYHVTRCIAFVRAEAYQDDPARPTAHCAAAFMRTSVGKRQ